MCAQCLRVSGQTRIQSRHSMPRITMLYIPFAAGVVAMGEGSRTVFPWENGVPLCAVMLQKRAVIVPMQALAVSVFVFVFVFVSLSLSLALSPFRSLAPTVLSLSTRLPPSLALSPFLPPFRLPFSFCHVCVCFLHVEPLGAHKFERCADASFLILGTFLLDVRQPAVRLLLCHGSPSLPGWITTSRKTGKVREGCRRKRCN